jgi:hypothetical protein
VTLSDARAYRMSCTRYVLAIAASYGLTWDTEQADNVLWEFTGFTAFWPEPELTPAANLERQVRAYIEEGPVDLLLPHGRPFVDVVTSL